MRRLLPLVVAALIAIPAAWSQTQNAKRGMQMAGIAFYNLENLFDTIPNSAEGRDIEYTPGGPKKWDSRKYNDKLDNLSYAISQFTSPTTPNGPAIIGVSEIENRHGARRPCRPSRPASVESPDSPITIRPMPAASMSECSTTRVISRSRMSPTTA